MTQTLLLEGRRYVILPAEEFDQLLKAAGRTDELPPYPDILPSGNRPAIETVRTILARKIITARTAAGLSQADLARLSRIRVETLNRIERAKVSPDASTMNKIEKALAKKGQRV
jgi:DNA-binding XRE family transcriptional regulator